MYQIIVNPGARSGRGKKNWEKIKSVLDSKEIPYAVHFTGKAGDAAMYARTLYEEACKMNELLKLIVLGGDGTMNEVVQGLPAFDNLELSCIPVGSSNDLARAMGISFVPEEAINHILSTPETLNMDLGEIHCELSSDGENKTVDKRFIVSTGFGYDAAICAEANASTAKKILNKIGMGKLIYLIICLKQLASVSNYEVEIKLESQKEPVHLENMLFVGGMNNRFEGGGFMFAPEAQNNDGKIDLCVVNGIPKTRVPKILPYAMKGEHLQFDGVNIYRETSYSIRSNKPLWVHTDGEADTMADYIEVSCQKEVVKMVF